MRVWLVAICLFGCTSSDAQPAPAPPRLSAAPANDPPPPPVVRESSPRRYPFDRTHSPIDATVAARLRDIAKKNPHRSEKVFAKVGDSITFSGDFLRCFDSDKPNFAEHEDLRTLVSHFRGSFARESHAARVGWSAWKVLAGSPSPLERELDESSARFVFVQFGTNDIQLGQLHRFADNLFDIIELTIDRGAIPILFTIPPRKDRREAAVWVPRYNAVIRGVAQARQIPLVDYHRELLKLPGSGLAKDGIHPSTFHGKAGRNACDLGKEALRHGYNLRNWLALTALERTSEALSAAAPDPPSRPEPAVPPELPLIDYVRFGDERTRRLTLELDRATSVRAMTFDRKGAVDLQLGEKSAERLLQQRVAAGSHELVLSASQARAESLLIVMAD